MLYSLYNVEKYVTARYEKHDSIIKSMLFPCCIGKA